MEFGVWTKGLATLAVDCLVLGVFEEGELSGEARSVDAACGGRLKKLLGTRGFRRPHRRDAAGHGSARAHRLARAAHRPGQQEELPAQELAARLQAALALLARTRIASCAVALDRPEAQASWTTTTSAARSPSSPAPPSIASTI